MKLKLNDSPEDFIKKYDISPKIDQNGYVYVEIRHGIYGIPKSGLLAQNA